MIYSETVIILTVLPKTAAAYSPSNKNDLDPRDLADSKYLKKQINALFTIWTSTDFSILCAVFFLMDFLECL